MSGKKIHAYLRAGGAGFERERVGPFLATFTPGSGHPMRNYAVPDDDARPSRTEVEALIDAYRRRGLTPRLEYSDDAAPDVEAALAAAGFRVEARLVVLGCRAGEEHALDPVPRFSVALAESAQDHVDALVVAGDAYGEPGVPDEAAIGARLRTVAAGGAVALVRERSTREPAGSGLVGVPRAGVSELAAVGTRAQFRNQGVAGAITALLTRDAFARGLELLWLTAEGAQAERIYARVGYRPIRGHMVHMSLPEGERPAPGAGPANRKGPSGNNWAMAVDSDAAVIAASLADPERFGVLFDRHATAMYRYFVRRVGADTADSLLGELFRVAFERRASYDGAHANARPWLYGIATRLLARHHRSEARRLLATARLVASTDRDSDPTDQLIGAMDARAVWPVVADALTKLPEGERDVLLLYAWEDLSYQDIATALGLPIGTVRSRMHRARRALRELSDPSGR